MKKIDYTKEILGGLIDYGLDHFFGTACCPSTDWLYAYIDGKAIPTPPTKVLDRSTVPDHAYSIDCRLGMVAEDFDLEEVDIKFLEKSQAFLKKHHSETPDKPFFLFHSTQTVHLPSFPGKAFKGKTNSRPHGDFIFELDYVVGELMKTLDELGVADNTIVILSSDNGPEVPTIFHMRHDHDGAKPWRGVKRDNWEGGHRVPFIVRWPEKVKAGTESSQLLCLTDVMATVAEVLDFELPNFSAEDSLSMVSTLRGEDKGQPIRPYILQQGFGGNNYAKHHQLREYELKENLPDAPAQLYDLDADPAETRNLLESRPDIAAELKATLEHSIVTGLSVETRAAAAIKTK